MKTTSPVLVLSFIWKSHSLHNYLKTFKLEQICMWECGKIVLAVKTLMCCSSNVLGARKNKSPHVMLIQTDKWKMLKMKLKSSQLHFQRTLKLWKYPLCVFKNVQTQDKWEQPWHFVVVSVWNVKFDICTIRTLEQWCQNLP